MRRTARRGPVSVGQVLAPLMQALDDRFAPLRLSKQCQAPEDPTPRNQSSLQRSSSCRTGAADPAAGLRPASTYSRTGAALVDLAVSCLNAIRPESVEKLARDLGVSPESLRRLGIGFREFAYTFPMFDADERIIGLRLRPKAGGKITLEGSALGLFLPVDVTPANVQMVCEGESDAAAADTSGFAAIGVPGSGQCTDKAVRFIRRRANPCPCIVGDNDESGRNGAEALASALLLAGVPCRILFPPEPHKDLRDWLRAGLITHDLQAAVEKSPVQYPERWPQGFTKVPHAPIRAGIIACVGRNAWAVLSAIATFTGAEGLTMPSRETLAGLLGFSVDTVDRAKEKLHEAGLLDWYRGGKVRGRLEALSNRYFADFGPCAGALNEHTFRPALLGRRRWRAESGISEPPKAIHRTRKTAPDAPRWPRTGEDRETRGEGP